MALNTFPRGNVNGVGGIGGLNKQSRIITSALPLFSGRLRLAGTVATLAKQEIIKIGYPANFAAYGMGISAGALTGYTIGLRLALDGTSTVAAAGKGITVQLFHRAYGTTTDTALLKTTGTPALNSYGADGGGYTAKYQLAAAGADPAFDAASLVDANTLPALADGDLILFSVLAVDSGANLANVNVQAFILPQDANDLGLTTG